MAKVPPGTGIFTNPLTMPCTELKLRPVNIENYAGSTI